MNLFCFLLFIFRSCRFPFSRRAAASSFSVAVDFHFLVEQLLSPLHFQEPVDDHFHVKHAAVFSSSFSVELCRFPFSRRAAAFSSSFSVAVDFHFLVEQLLSTLLFQEL